MDPEMQQRAQAKAAELGISFAEYVRRLVAQDLVAQNVAEYDITEMFDLVKDGESTDIARDKHKLVGEALWSDYLRKTGRKPRPRKS